MKQQAFHTSHYPITGISRESLLIFCLKTVTVQHLHSYNQKRSVFRFQSYLRYCLPGISHSHEVPSLCGVQYLLLFVTTFFSVPLPVFETVSADITIVGFFSFVKVFVDTRIKIKSQALNAKNITGFCVLSFSQFPFCFFVHIQQPSNFAISSLKRSSAVP